MSSPYQQDFGHPLENDINVYSYYSSMLAKNQDTKGSTLNTYHQSLDRYLEEEEEVNTWRGRSGWFDDDITMTQYNNNTLNQYQGAIEDTGSEENSFTAFLSSPVTQTVMAVTIGFVALGFIISLTMTLISTGCSDYSSDDKRSHHRRSRNKKRSKKSRRSLSRVHRSRRSTPRSHSQNCDSDNTPSSGKRRDLDYDHTNLNTSDANYELMESGQGVITPSRLERSTSRSNRNRSSRKRSSCRKRRSKSRSRRSTPRITSQYSDDNSNPGRNYDFDSPPLIIFDPVESGK